MTRRTAAPHPQRARNFILFGLWATDAEMRGIPVWLLLAAAALFHVVARL